MAKSWTQLVAINSDAAIELFTWNNDEGKATMWHSSAHLMAETIELLIPGSKIWYWPRY